MKARIVKRTSPSGKISYVIQQRHFLFRWWWVDASMNYYGWCQDSYSTLKEAEQNLCWFDGTKTKNEVVK